MNRFLDLADFTREEVVDLIALARRLQDRPEPQALAGRRAARGHRPSQFVPGTRKRLRLHDTDRAMTAGQEGG